MKYDVIIVLAGGITDEGYLPDGVQKRIEKAKELFEAKYAPRVLMSGKWSTYREKHQPPTTEAEAMKKHAQILGIPQKVIFKEEYSHNTESNALNCLEHFLTPNNWKKIIVVTSDFHLPRTRYIFNRLLGHQYQIMYVPTSSNMSRLQLMIRKIKEYLSLQRFKKFSS